LSQQLFHSGDKGDSQLPMDPLARFVFVVGEVAIGQLSHMERLAVATKKRRLDYEENGGENIQEESTANDSKKKKKKAGKKGKKKKQEEEEESEDEGLDAMMGNNDQEADKELEFYESVAHKLGTRVCG
jgi:hypothetical protein